MATGPTRPLRLSDFLDDQEEPKQVTASIYYTAGALPIKVVGQPRRGDVDMFEFDLANGQTIERYIGGDTHDEGNQTIIDDMEIEIPMPRDDRHMAAGKRRKTRKHKRHSRKTRRHRKKSRKNRKH